MILKHTSITKTPRTLKPNISSDLCCVKGQYVHHFIEEGQLYLSESALFLCLDEAIAKNDKEAIEHLQAHVDALKCATIKVENLKKSEVLHNVVYGEVYIPNSIDTDNETMSEDAVREMAWEFLASGKVNKIDVMHDFKESGAVVVESYIQKEDDGVFNKGAWILGVKLTEELMEKVLKGELNGFSFGATTPVVKVPKQVIAEVVTSFTGETYVSGNTLIPGHIHEVSILFNEDGNIVVAKTSEVLGHTHSITKTTATDFILDHAHRFEVK